MAGPKYIKRIGKLKIKTKTKIQLLPASKMVYQIRAFVTKPDNQSLIPGTHVMKD